MKPIPLTPIEYIFTGAGSQPITFAFYYKEQLNPERLMAHLKETLEQFPILSSRLVKISEQEYGFKQDPDALTFTIRDSGPDFDETSSVLNYIEPIQTIEDAPLSRITLTQTEKGSVLAASISHALVDGFSFFHFLSTWARNTRQDRSLPPSLDRNTFNHHLHSNPFAKITAKNILEQSGLFFGEKRNDTDPLSVQEEREFISIETIRTHLLKFKKTNPDVSLTENDIITAMLWQKYVPQWCDTTIPETFITCPVDLRRVVKPLSRNYLGCAIAFATASMKLEDLKNKSIGEIAVIVKNAVKSINTDTAITAMQTLDMFRKENGPQAFEHLHLCHPGNGMIVTNLTRMPVQDINFTGSGPKGYLTFTDVSGGAAILASEDGVEVLVSMP